MLPLPIIAVHPTEPSILLSAAVIASPVGRSSSSPPWLRGAYMRKKPIDFSAYQVIFSKAQQARMKKVFPDGVCDWSKPSVGYSLIKGTYQRY